MEDYKIIEATTRQHEAFIKSLTRKPMVWLNEEIEKGDINGTTRK